jgi:hypothetical protein
MLKIFFFGGFMNARNRFTFFGLIALLALVANLALPTLARADGAPPPPPASPSGSDASAKTSVAPVASLSQVPADTSVVAVNKKGRAEPLATQAAAKIVDTGDPIWCPSGTAPIPGIGGCTASYSNLASLIDDINGSVISQPAANGIIWINAGTDNSSSDIDINGGSLGTWANYALTLQGGWNGSGAGSVTGTSGFSKQIAVMNWNNDVTINDITISGATYDGLDVFTNGDIVVHHVTSSSNGSSGANLENEASGSINVSSSVFNSNDYFGLLAFSAGDITLNNVTASHNGVSCSDFCFEEGNGMLISARGNVSLTKVTTDQNQGSGFYSWSGGDTTLSNVTANDNGLNCEFCFESSADGMDIFSQGNATLTNVTADRNLGTGVRVISNGDITLNNTEANGNGMFGAELIIEENGGAIVVNCGSYNDNGNNTQPSLGLSLESERSGAGIYAQGSSLTLNNVDLSGNPSPYIFNNGDGTPKFGSTNCGGGGGSDGHHTNPGLPLHTVNVTGGEATGLDCTQYSGTELILPDNDSALFPCPVSDSASLGALTSDSLPGALPSGDTYVSAFSTGVTQDGTSVSPVSGPITVSFAVPDNMKNANLAILYWDGSKWVEVPGGHMTADGHFEAPTNFTGTFVLVSK